MSFAAPLNPVAAAVYFGIASVLALICTFPVSSTLTSSVAPSIVTALATVAVTVFSVPSYTRPSWPSQASATVSGSIV